MAPDTLASAPSTEIIRTINLKAYGIAMDVCNVGASITALHVPDRAGKSENIVLSYVDSQHYLSNPSYLGCSIGRFANRIAGGRFAIGHESFQVSRNESGINCLHGGEGGIHRAVWQQLSGDNESVTFTHLSPDGDQGFPGALAASVTYRIVPRVEGISDNPALRVDYYARSTQPTPVSLTNHSYFNLDGAEYGSSVAGHYLQLPAGRYTPVNDLLIPDGRIINVSAELDYRQTKKLENAVTAGGLDHNFVIPGRAGDMRHAASIFSEQSGRSLKVYSTQPGIQVYTGQHLAKPFNPFQGICLETQSFPDSPNQPGFPSCILRPGEDYLQTTIFCFEKI